MGAARAPVCTVPHSMHRSWAPPVLALCTALLSGAGLSSSVTQLTFYSNGNGELADPKDAALLASLNATMLTTANLSMLEAAWTEHRLGGMLTVDSAFKFYLNPATGQREGGGSARAGAALSRPLWTPPRRSSPRGRSGRSSSAMRCAACRECRGRM